MQSLWQTLVIPLLKSTFINKIIKYYIITPIQMLIKEDIKQTNSKNTNFVIILIGN